MKNKVSIHRKKKTLVLERDGWKCQKCGVETPQELRGTKDPRAPEVDHIVSRDNGGTNDLQNLRCLCRLCNGTAGGKISGDKNAEKPGYFSKIGRLGSHENKSIAGRLGGIKGSKNQPLEAKIKGGKTTSKKLLEERPEHFVRMRKISAHSRWHEGRGIVNLDCDLCKEKLDARAKTARP